MSNNPISIRSSDRRAVLAEAISGMCRSFKIVMGWQNVEPPSRIVIGSGPMRTLVIRIREQPVNFLITVHQSLETAKSGQGLCRVGTKASRILLGEEVHHDRTKSQFVSKTVDEIRGYVASLTQCTNEIYHKFRLLRRTLLDVHNGLSKLTSEEQRSALLARLSRQLSKDVRVCENELRKVLDDLEAVENSLNVITRWWQQIESEAIYLKLNGESSLAVEKNAITLREIRDGFTALDSCFDGYVDKMGVLYDTNIVQLNPENKKHLANNPDLVCSEWALLEFESTRKW